MYYETFLSYKRYSTQTNLFPNMYSEILRINKNHKLVNALCADLDE